MLLVSSSCRFCLPSKPANILTQGKPADILTNISLDCLLQILYFIDLPDILFSLSCLNKKFYRLISIEHAIENRNACNGCNSDRKCSFCWIYGSCLINLIITSNSQNNITFNKQSTFDEKIRQRKWYNLYKFYEYNVLLDIISNKYNDKNIYNTCTNRNKMDYNCDYKSKQYILNNVLPLIAIECKKYLLRLQYCNDFKIFPIKNEYNIYFYNFRCHEFYKPNNTQEYDQLRYGIFISQTKQNYPILIAEIFVFYFLF